MIISVSLNAQCLCSATSGVGYHWFSHKPGGWTALRYNSVPTIKREELLGLLVAVAERSAFCLLSAVITFFETYTFRCLSRCCTSVSSLESQYIQ